MAKKHSYIICTVIILTGLLFLPVHAEETPSPVIVSESPDVPDVPDTDDAVSSPESVSSDPIVFKLEAQTQEMVVPAVFIPEPVFEFEPVVDGAEIVHDFIIQNQGNGLLLITDIRTGCACAVAEYPRYILPQQEDKITITIDTTGYGGRDDFSRTIMIATNDPMQSMQKAMISGRIDDFAKFDPKKVIIMRGPANEKLTFSVTITPSEQHPFTILDYELDDVLKDLVTIHLEKKDKKYILTTENNMKKAGRYMGKIHLHTDSSFKPQINMIIRGIIE